MQCYAYIWGWVKCGETQVVSSTVHLEVTIRLLWLEVLTILSKYGTMVIKSLTITILCSITLVASEHGLEQFFLTKTINAFTSVTFIHSVDNICLETAMCQILFQILANHPTQFISYDSVQLCSHLKTGSLMVLIDFEDQVEDGLDTFGWIFGLNNVWLLTMKSGQT